MIGINKQIASFALSLIILILAMTGLAFAAKLSPDFTSFMGFLWDDSLVSSQEVIKTLGTAPLVEKSDASDHHESSSSLCYRAKDGFIQFLFTPISDNADTTTPRLIGVRLSIQAPNNKCAPLPSAYAAQALKVGSVELGMQKDAFVQALGGGSPPKKSTLENTFSYQRPSTPAERAAPPGLLVPGHESTFSGTVIVRGQFIKDTLTTFTAWTPIEEPEEDQYDRWQ